MNTGIVHVCVAKVDRIGTWHTHYDYDGRLLKWQDGYPDNFDIVREYLEDEGWKFVQKLSDIYWDTYLYEIPLSTTCEEI